MNQNQNPEEVMENIHEARLFFQQLLCTYVREPGIFLVLVSVYVFKPVFFPHFNIGLVIFL